MQTFEHFNCFPVKCAIFFLITLYTLHFKVRGRAEFIRYILAYGGATYEDVRIERKQEWPKFKPTTIMGQIPIFEENGKQICQSVAIARYLAKKFDLIPSNDWDSARADMLVDGITEITPHVRTVNFAIMSGDQKRIVDAWNVFKAEHLPSFLDRYEKFLNENGTDYLVNNKLSWADLVLAEMIERFTTIFDDVSLLTKHPKLEKHMIMVHEIPNIKKHVNTRPEMIL